MCPYQLLVVRPEQSRQTIVRLQQDTQEYLISACDYALLTPWRVTREKSTHETDPSTTHHLLIAVGRACYVWRTPP